jgi:hypothetical protein
LLRPSSAEQEKPSASTCAQKVQTVSAGINTSKKAKKRNAGGGLPAAGDAGAPANLVAGAAPETEGNHSCAVGNR